MRCFFLKNGHIVAVEALALGDDSLAIKQAETIWKGHQAGKFDGYEIWDTTRVVFQYPKPDPDAETTT